jgi:hypothetical protein
MAKKKNSLTEGQQKSLLLLKSAYEMHCKTREEAIMMGKTSNLEKIDKVINETLQQIAQIDESFAKKCFEEQKEKSKKQDISDVIGSYDDSQSLYDVINSDDDFDMSEDKDIMKETQDFYEQFTDDDEVDLYKMADNIEDDKPVVDSFKQEPQEVGRENTEVTDAGSMIYNNTDPSAQYDLIPLPSKGECYRLKIDRVPVGYLTAADENLITSPNLYESGSISNILLKKKVLNKDIDIDSLVSGDVDAIMVFLRGTSYGNDFPITATDPSTGVKVDTSVDLSTLKYKPFNLKGDENGLFDFKLPRSGALVKFRFLTKKDERILKQLSKKESKGVAAYEIEEAISKIKDALKADDKLNDSDRSQIISSNEMLQKWADGLGKKKSSLPYTKSVTNSMEMQIVSINGNFDKKFIHEFVMNMPASDSLAFRRYVYDNQPGVDFEVEVKRPVSHGGGTFKCFLEWDDYVFWNIS